MKLENISLYNFTNAIDHLIDIKDSNYGSADYDTVKKISREKGRSVIDTIFLQNEDKVCEYFVIGNKDLQELLTLKDTHIYKEAMDSISVQMIITASPEWITELDNVKSDCLVVKRQDGKYTLILTYADIARINKNISKPISDNWDYFLSRINSLPYVQQLIF